MLVVKMGIISPKQSHRTGVGVGSRSEDFGDISWTTVFTKSSVTKLKLCKYCARELNRVSRDWSVRVKAVSNLLNLTHKEFIKLIRERLGGNI